VKKIILTFALSLGLSADYYMAQIQPYQTHSVEAEIGGIVTKIALNKEFSYIDKTTRVVELDSTNEHISIDALSQRVDALKEALQLKRENLKSKANVRQISKYELNGETLSVIDTKQALLSTEMELKLQKSNLEKKRFYLTDGYLGEIFVDEFEFVSPGEKIFNYYDFSKSRLDLYVTEEDLIDIESKKVYIDGIESDWNIEKVSSVKDSQKISTYLVRVVIDNRDPKKAKFGKVVKVEFK
jgi:hypothetical protein